MSDNFNYWKASPDWEFLEQFSQEERDEFFQSKDWVVEVMSKYQVYIRWLSWLSWITQQKIADFIFSEQIKKRRSNENYNVPQGTPKKILAVLESAAEPIAAQEPEINPSADKELEFKDSPASEPAEESGADWIIEASISEPTEEFKNDLPTRVPVSEPIQELSISWYDIVWELKEWRRRVRKNGKYWFLDSDNKEVIKCKYEDVNDFCEWAAVVYGENGLYWFIWLDWEQITECKFSDALDFSEGLAAVKLNNKWWYIDKTWKLAIKYLYTDAESFNDWKAKVELWRQSVYINKSWFAV
ncbi:MAG: KWG repeat protein [uncultured bacterium (gcode 4)]|uniref:KWG repeat protein n=1 Tax=uncultured bacterium (gcode 4) TaxID=1234023 RepID=K2GWP5_9BACT|nr:MAG: KWG repeat protein [uncultured bacterium (gcode 4)]